jgi:RNA polymerase sigma factor (sigma-70 family)
MSGLELLVSEARTGDREAFGRLVQRYQDMAYAMAYSALRDFQLAEDATQEAFLNVFQRLQTLRVPASFPGWLRRIVLKHCDRLRRRRRVSTVPLEGVAEPPAGEECEVERSERTEWLGKMLGALPETERRALSLFYLGGHSLREVASFLEIPLTTAKNRLHAARQHLAERGITMVEQTLKQKILPDNFWKVVLGRLNEQELKFFDGSPVHKMANLLLTHAIARGADRMELGLDGRGVTLRMRIGGRWHKFDAMPARLLPALLMLLAAASNKQPNADRLEAELPLEDGKEARVAKIQVKRLLLSVSL